MDSSALVEYIYLVRDLIRDKLSEFLMLELREIRFVNLGLVHFVGLFLIIVIVARLFISILWRGKKYFWRKHSGSAEYYKYATSFLSRLLRLIPRFLIFSSLLFLLVSLASPFFVDASRKTVMSTGRVRVELRDTSSSMEENFSGTSVPKAIVAEEKHLKFLKMREGKGDRNSFWLFGSNPYLIQDFVADDEFYRYKVSSAPLMVCATDITQGYEKYPLRDRYVHIPGEGCGTVIDRPLRQIITQLKNDPVANKVDPVTKKVPEKSIPIVTDAEVSTNPEKELIELKKMGVKIYVIWIASGGVNYADDGTSYQPFQPPFLEEVRKYGGNYWNAGSPNALAEAFAAVDKMEAANYEEIVIESKRDLTDIFIFLSAVSLLGIILIGLILTLRIGTSP